MPNSFYENLTRSETFTFVYDILKQALESVYIHPVTFSLVWHPLAIDKHGIHILDDEELTDKYPEEALQHQIERCCYWTWDTVLFPQQKLHIRSRQAGNDDDRGGGCGKLNIPVAEFVWEKDCPDGIRLQDLTEAIYRMKGSKYDWWYEYFDGMCTDEERDLLDDELSLVALFGYGS